MILYDWKSGLSAQQSNDRLNSAFPDQAPSQATVFAWFAEFRRGRQSLKDDARTGRPSEACTPDMVERAREIINEDRRITYEQIQQELHISSGSINSILHDHLHLKKVECRWVPHHLTETQKNNRVDWCRFMLRKYDRGQSRQVYEIITGDETWIYDFDPETRQQSAVWMEQGAPRPTQVKRSRTVGKRMVAVFFRRSGLVKVVPVEQHRTVTAEWYCTVCLPAVFAELRNSRPKSNLRNIQLHHDNAPAHTAARTLDYLHEEGVQLIPHPPYSPDLAPCDFYLFEFVKRQLRGKRFNDDNEAISAFKECISNITQDDWRDCFKNWFARMQACINAHGEYFEHV
jgi:histone-lysine N-methyltransferase SETMAR